MAFGLRMCLALWAFFAMLATFAAVCVAAPVLAIEVLGWPMPIIVPWAIMVTPPSIVLLATGAGRLGDWCSDG